MATKKALRILAADDKPENWEIDRRPFRQEKLPAPISFLGSRQCEEPLNETVKEKRGPNSGECN